MAGLQREKQASNPILKKFSRVKLYDAFFVPVSLRPFPLHHMPAISPSLSPASMPVLSIPVFRPLSRLRGGFPFKLCPVHALSECALDYVLDAELELRLLLCARGVCGDHLSRFAVRPHRSDNSTLASGVFSCIRSSLADRKRRPARSVSMRVYPLRCVCSLPADSIRLPSLAVYIVFTMCCFYFVCY